MTDGSITGTVAEARVAHVKSHGGDSQHVVPISYEITADGKPEFVIPLGTPKDIAGSVLCRGKLFATKEATVSRLRAKLAARGGAGGK
jgi:hypothetical protein